MWLLTVKSARTATTSSGLGSAWSKAKCGVRADIRVNFAEVRTHRQSRCLGPDPRHKERYQCVLHAMQTFGLVQQLPSCLSLSWLDSLSARQRNRLLMNKSRTCVLADVPKISNHAVRQLDSVTCPWSLVSVKARVGSKAVLTAEASCGPKLH